MPHSQSVASWGLLWVVATACGGPVGGGGDSAVGGPGLSMSGIAYQFQTRLPLAGARISLLELPEREAW